MQIKAGITKELQQFSRTFKMWGLIIAFIAFAIIDPLIIKGTDVLINNIDYDNMFTYEIEDNAQDMNRDAAKDGFFNTSINFDMDMQQSLDIFSSRTNASTAYSVGMSDLSGSVLLIMLLLLMSTAGGEIKKRNTIIPMTSGLQPINYIIPKFIIYPLFIMLMSILSAFICAGTSLIFFPDSSQTLLSIPIVLTGAIALGFYLIFNMSILFAFGICTGRAGIGVLVVYISSIILPVIFSVFEANKFHPYALNAIAVSPNETTDWTNYFVSIIMTLIIMAVLFFMCLFVMKARQIDNSSKNPYIQ